MAKPTPFEAEFVRGDDEEFLFTVKTAGGTPIDITGWTFWMTAKQNVTDTDEVAIFQRTSANGGAEIVDAAQGQARILIRAADTAALPGETKLVADLQARTNTGRIRTLMQGTFTVTVDVTRTAV